MFNYNTKYTKKNVFLSTPFKNKKSTYPKSIISVAELSFIIWSFKILIWLLKLVFLINILVHNTLTMCTTTYTAVRQI